MNLTIYEHCRNICHWSILVMWSRPYVLLLPTPTPYSQGADSLRGSMFWWKLGRCLLVVGIYPYVTNGTSVSYHLNESIFNYMGIKSDISFYNLFQWKSCKQKNEPKWDAVYCCVTSDVTFCFTMHIKICFKWRFNRSFHASAKATKFDLP